jgi:hypothetical protein
LEIYDKEVGINWTWQSLDSISIKSPLGGPRQEIILPIDRSKLGTKRHILNDKKGIPLSDVVSSASTHDIKLVTEVVDKVIIKRPKSLSKSKLKSRRRPRRRLQHLCLDKGYKSTEKEQELIKRGYVLHIPYKKKRGEEEDHEQQIKAIPNRKKYSARRWVVYRKDKLMA